MAMETPIPVQASQRLPCLRQGHELHLRLAVLARNGRVEARATMGMVVVLPSYKYKYKYKHKYKYTHKYKYKYK